MPCATHSNPVQAILVGYNGLTTWKILNKPDVKLAPKTYIQGHYGQAFIVGRHHKDHQFHYFLCRKLNGECIYLLAENSWYPTWWRKFLSSSKLLSFNT